MLTTQSCHRHSTSRRHECNQHGAKIYITPKLHTAAWYARATDSFDDKCFCRWVFQEPSGRRCGRLTQGTKGARHGLPKDRPRRHLQCVPAPDFFREFTLTTDVARTDLYPAQHVGRLRDGRVQSRKAAGGATVVSQSVARNHDCRRCSCARDWELSRPTNPKHSLTT